MKKDIVFFDVETNGLVGSSVLSISAMKIQYNLETDEMIKLGEFDRFYYRNEGEEINEGAVLVNGLTDDEIARRRSLSSIEYARTFIEDIPSFIEFCGEAEHFVAHNIRFDRSFIPFALKYQFDTMIENIQIVKIPSPKFIGSYKWPKLDECAKFYGIELEEDQLHNSMYDVIIMARVFYVMNKKKIAKDKIKRFIIDNIGTNFNDR